MLRMLVVSVAFYGMSTFEGPMMSIKVVNSLSHYTDWTIGHVHSGALGWVGFVSFGALYCLVPWLWDRKGLYSLKLVNWHFWIATIGIVLYISAMWVSGILQGLMWRAYTSLGFLEYSFIETVEAMHPFYIIRAAGGALFLIGALIMSYNLWMTVRVGEAEVAVAASPCSRRNKEQSNVVLEQARDLREELDRPDRGNPRGHRHRRAPSRSPRCFISRARSRWSTASGRIPRSSSPAATSTSARAATSATRRWSGPLRDEVERYGHYSLAAESMYDHPFQWGSKRTGPDLARVGAKYSDEWHVTHLTNPRAIVPQSVMPGYPFLAEDGDRHGRRVADHPADQPRGRRALFATTRSPMPSPISRRRSIRTMPARTRSPSAIRRRLSAISTARRARRPRWTRWSPTCRCSAPWSTSSFTTKKQIFAEKAER